MFCASCGIRLSEEADRRSCPRCGAPVMSGDRHCRRCGAVLAGEDTKAIPVTRESTGSNPHSGDPDRVGHDTGILPVASRPREPYLEPRSWTAGPADEAGAVPYEDAPTRRRGAPVGAILALIAAAAVVASGFLEWRAESLGGGSAADIPLRFLTNPKADARQGEITIALVLLGLGTLGALASLVSMLVPWLRFVRRLIGGLTLLVPVVFVVRSELALRLLSGEHSILDSIGRGAWLCAIAAAVEISAGRWFRR